MTAGFHNYFFLLATQHLQEIFFQDFERIISADSPVLFGGEILVTRVISEAT
jgi:hypothetical protein